MKTKFIPLIRPARFVAALALALTATPADAVNFYWDGNSTTGDADGGNGTWNTSTTNWDTAATGGGNVTWGNATNSDAFFGGTAGTVTLGGNITARKMTFSTTGYTLDLAGNTLTTGTAGNPITAGVTTTTISDSAGTGGWNISSLASTISVSNGGLVTVNAKITGNGSMDVGGGGSVSLTNDTNDFTGILEKQNNNALTISSIKNSGVASAAGAGNLVLVGFNSVIIYNGSGDSTNRTLGLNASGNAALRNNGGSGALTWTGAFNNTTTANATFTLGGNNTANNELQGTLTDNGTNVLSVTKADAGKWVLSGNNTYTGNTTVSTGTLLINGNSSAATGAVNVASGATLGGSGTIGGATTVNGNLQPGNSPGVLNFSAGLSLTSTANTTMEINGSTTRGTDFDGINVNSSALVYDGTLTLAVGTTFGVGSYTFNLFDFGSQSGSFDAITLSGSYTGSLAGPGNVWTLASGNNTWTFTHSTGDLGLSVIPEPSTWALIAFSLTTVLILRRRRMA